MYKLIKDSEGIVRTVQRLLDNAFIPFVPGNTDYQQFKTDLANGASLEDAEGNIMTPEQVTIFLDLLP